MISLFIILSKQDAPEEFLIADNAPPSKNPASTGDMPSALREILDKFLKSSIDDMLPAKVVTHDRVKNRVLIQPMITITTTLGEQVSRNQFASVPVFNIGGGGFLLSFNLKEGDLGWIKAADRDIAEFLKGFKQAAAATMRVHNFSNGIFIPDVMTGYQIDAEDDENAVLQTLDGTVRVSLFPNKLKFTAPEIINDTPITKFTVDIETTGNASLGAGGQPIARLGDAVSVVVTSGSSAGTYAGIITAGSANHTAT